MCSCKKLLVSSDLTNHGIVEQRCKECGAIRQVPGTMTAVLDYIRQKESIYRHSLNFIETYYSRIM